MKTSFYAFAALMAAVIALGCIAPAEQQPTQPEALRVTPTQVIGEGVITVQYTLTNSFENNMENVDISLLNVPSSYDVSAKPAKATIVPDQQFPVIFTIETPSVSIKQTISPKLQICYDYDTAYFFDSALKRPEQASETAPTEMGSSTGPIAVSQVGLDTVFTNTQAHTGSLQITNTGGGKIQKFNSLSVSEESAYITSVTLAYSRCGGDTGQSLLPGSSRSADCDILSNSLAIGDGLTATLRLNTDGGASSLTSVVPERISGEVSTNYCSEVQVGTITVCPAGRAC